MRRWVAWGLPFLIAACGDNIVAGGGIDAGDTDPPSIALVTPKADTVAVSPGVR